MDLAEVKKSAEAVLAGVGEDDSWRGQAQGQARNVLNIIGLIGESDAKFKKLESTIGRELAEAKAKAEDLASQKVDAASAKEFAAKVAAELEALKKDHNGLILAVKDLIDGKAAKDVAESKISSALVKLGA